MNKYLEKIAEINKEAMNTKALADIARQVGLRREGDWRGLARQFADNKGQLLPARQRAAVREKITGVGNNAVQKIFSAQERARDSDELLGMVSEKTKKILPTSTPLSRRDGLIDNPGMGLMDPRIHASDAQARQGKAIANAQQLSALLTSNHGKHQMIHTHPQGNFFRLANKTSRFQTANREFSDIDPMIADVAMRSRLPASSMGGAGIASTVRGGSTLRNKQDAHMLARGFPEVDRSKLANPMSQEFNDEVQRVTNASKTLTESMSPAMQRRFGNASMGDHNTFPQVNRRNSIIGMDRTLGVHTQGLVPTGRADLSPQIPVSYQHAYFDIGQGGHQAIRRMLKKGLNPEERGLNTSFLK